jgi:hypothetical protein
MPRGERASRPRDPCEFGIGNATFRPPKCQGATHDCFRRPQGFRYRELYGSSWRRDHAVRLAWPSIGHDQIPRRHLPALHRESATKYTAGILFAAIVTALYRRERAGVGGVVSTSQLASLGHGVSVQNALCGGEVVYRQPRDLQRCRCAVGAQPNWPEARVVPQIFFVDQLHDRIRVALLGDEGQHEPPATSAAIEVRQRIARTRAGRCIHAQGDSAQWQQIFGHARHPVGIVAWTVDAVADEQMRLFSAIVRATDVPGGCTVDSPFLLLQSELKPSPRGAVSASTVTRFSGPTDMDQTRSRSCAPSVRSRDATDESIRRPSLGNSPMGAPPCGHTIKSIVGLTIDPT